MIDKQTKMVKLKKKKKNTEKKRKRRNKQNDTRKGKKKKQILKPTKITIVNTSLKISFRSHER